jgi:hypothetical protein
LRRVLECISTNIDKEITLAQLAGVASLSVFHFARTFTRAMGVSPHRYVSRIRLENAMADIAAGKLSLAEIAFQRGLFVASKLYTGILSGEWFDAGKIPDTPAAASDRADHSDTVERKSAQNDSKNGKDKRPRGRLRWP